MNYYDIQIGKKSYHLPDPPTECTIALRGIGNVFATAVSHININEYKVTIIYGNNVETNIFTDFVSAMNYIHETLAFAEAWSNEQKQPRRKKTIDDI